MAPAGDGLADAEFGAAAAIDPDGAAVVVPGLPLDASRAADLARQADVTSTVCVAEVSLAVVGGAGDDQRLTARRAASAAACNELGTAATVDPDGTVVIAPGLSLDTGRAADLAGQADAAAGVGVAEVSLAIVGRASEILRTASASPVATVACNELGATAAVDPDGAVVIAPGLSLDTGRAADLAGQADAATGVGVAEVSFAVVGRTSDGLAISTVSLAGLRVSRCGY